MLFESRNISKFSRARSKHILFGSSAVERMFLGRAQTKYLSCLGRARLSTFALVEQARNIPIFGRDGRNIPIFGRDGRNKPIFGRDGRSIPNFGRDGRNIPIFGRDGRNKPIFSRDDRNISVFSRDGVGRDCRNIK